jgi:hypothetical protein
MRTIKLKENLVTFIEREPDVRPHEQAWSEDFPNAYDHNAKYFGWFVKTLGA